MPVDFFDQAMDFIWQGQNDGQSIHTTAGDPGGATCWGVTWKSWQGWCLQNDEPIDYDAFCALPKAEFRPFYHTNYWNAARCNLLGAAGIVACDTAVLSGPGRAIKLLQRTAGTIEDGLFGPITATAVCAIRSPELIQAYTATRIAFLRALPNFPRFPGWVPRAERCRDFALSSRAKTLATAAGAGAVS